jgi:hypothetical protein
MRFVRAASTLTALVCLALAGAGCGDSSSSTTPPPPTTTPTLIATITLPTGGGTHWPQYTVAALPIGSNATGITAATASFAVDATAFSNSWNGATWQSNGSHGWDSTNAAVSGSNTWTTYSWTLPAVETTAVQVQVWSSAATLAAFSNAKIYVKSFVLTYADGATETLTFPDSTGTTLHSVYTPSGGSAAATDPLLTARIWHWTDDASGLTEVSLAEGTVSF